MIKDRTYKLIVAGLTLIFFVGLFFSVRFIKNKITEATSPPGQITSETSLNMDAWEKIKHRFQK